MSRSPIYQADYRPQFSGHETFPLRYGWLKKAHAAVVQSQTTNNKSIFLSDDAIARFGVGKNMVASIRHWSTTCGILNDTDSGSIVTTPLGDLIFGDDGLDQYLEFPASLWILHWCLCTNPRKATTFFWAFNHYSSPIFTRDDLVEGLMRLASDLGWLRVSPTTVRRDVECFVRTYETRTATAAGAGEDMLESPLAELGLLRGIKGSFQFVRGPKPSLPSSVFAFALYRFWEQQGARRTLSFERIAHEPGSPGRVFLLDEPDLFERLNEVEDATAGALRWSETAGLKQVVAEKLIPEETVFALLRQSYESRATVVFNAA